MSKITFILQNILLVILDDKYGYLQIYSHLNSLWKLNYSMSIFSETFSNTLNYKNAYGDKKLNIIKWL